MDHITGHPQTPLNTAKHKKNPEKHPKPTLKAIQ